VNGLAGSVADWERKVDVAACKTSLRRLESNDIFHDCAAVFAGP
jgi:hypothetical protein